MPIVLNTRVARVPIRAIDDTQTMMISASMMAYSTAVGPSSLARKRATQLQDLDIGFLSKRVSQLDKCRPGGDFSKVADHSLE